MANEGLYERQKLIGMLYRNELARNLADLGYGIEKTHADGRFEIAGVSREVVEAFSTRRAEIEAAMEERNLGATGDNPRIAERAALMTRAAKRDVDRDALQGNLGESGGGSRVRRPCDRCGGRGEGRRALDAKGRETARRNRARRLWAERAHRA